jgi:hypothetical protein
LEPVGRPDAHPGPTSGAVQAAKLVQRGSRLPVLDGGPLRRSLADIECAEPETVTTEQPLALVRLLADTGPRGATELIMGDPFAGKVPAALART